jgi:hypothetical protein
MPFQNNVDIQSNKMIDKITISLIGKAIREGKYLTLLTKIKMAKLLLFGYVYWILTQTMNFT